MFEVDTESELKEFELDYDEYLHALGELSHKPLHGPRESHVGENVYAFEWEVMHASVRRDNDPPNVLLASMLYAMQRRITQRHASVAASFITWLGTNCGMAYLNAAKRLRDCASYSLMPREAYLAAWAIDNQRSLQVNHGGRLIESILAPADHFGRDLFTGLWGLRRMPDLSIEDHETVEHVASWLGTPRAQEFIARCDHLIHVRQRVETPMDTLKVIMGVEK